MILANVLLETVRRSNGQLVSPASVDRSARRGSPRVPARAPHTSTPSSLRRCPSRSEPAPCTRTGISATDARRRASISGAKHPVGAAPHVDPGRPRAGCATSPRCTCRSRKDQDCLRAGPRLHARGIASSRCQHCREHGSRRDPALGVPQCARGFLAKDVACGCRRDAFTCKQDDALGTFGGKSGESHHRTPRAAPGVRRSTLRPDCVQPPGASGR